jgi:hypothetical protein
MMARDFTSSRFLSSGFESETDVDPRVGLVNLADVMLVFACGLMLALVAYWNLDVADMKEVVRSEQVTEVQDVEDITDNAGSGGGFIELGKVYQDPMTGKYYMLQEDMEKSSAGAAGQGQPDDGGASGQEAGAENDAAEADGGDAANAGASANGENTVEQ